MITRSVKSRHRSTSKALKTQKMSRQNPHAEPEDDRVRSVLDRQRPMSQQGPHTTRQAGRALKTNTLKTKDDTPSPAEAERLSQWNGVLPRHFSKVTQSYCQYWFHTSGEHPWTLRAWGKHVVTPGTCRVYVVNPVFWTPTPLCSFRSKHHVTLILIHKGHMFFRRVHSDSGKS